MGRLQKAHSHFCTATFTLNAAMAERIASCHRIRIPNGSISLDGFFWRRLLIREFNSFGQACLDFLNERPGYFIQLFYDRRIGSERPNHVYEFLDRYGQIKRWVVVGRRSSDVNFINKQRDFKAAVLPIDCDTKIRHTFSPVLEPRKDRSMVEGSNSSLLRSRPGSIEGT